VVDAADLRTLAAAAVFAGAGRTEPDRFSLAKPDPAHLAETTGLAVVNDYYSAASSSHAGA
jgi:hypothetical protein